MLKIHGNKEMIKVTYVLYAGLLIFLISMIGAYMNGDIDFLRDHLLETLSYYIGIPLLGICLHIGFGREIELNESGCTIRCLFIRRRYSWEQMQYRQWFDYPRFMTKRTSYPGGFIFSVKPVRTLFGKTDIDKYSFLHPFSSINIHFPPEDGSKQQSLRGYIANYEVDQRKFYDFIQRINLSIKDLPPLR